MRFHLPIVGLLVLAAGCGGTNVVAVSGRVTIGDKPIANATVIFYPLSDEQNPGPGSQGKTDKDGKFSLELVAGGKKAGPIGRPPRPPTPASGGEEITSCRSRPQVNKQSSP